jgi:hypothetical protein
MPAGPIGSCWASGSWSDTAWEADTWSGAVVSALAFVLDLNTRLLVYLQDYYSTSNPDLATLTLRYLNGLSGEFTARFNKLIQDATDAMS